MAQVNGVVAEALRTPPNFKEGFSSALMLKLVVFFLISSKGAVDERVVRASSVYRMSDKRATNQLHEGDFSGLNPFSSGGHTSGSTPSAAEASLLDLGLGSQASSTPQAATIDTTSELLVPGIHNTSDPGLSAGRVQSAETMNNFGSAAVDIDLVS
ncbi:unnamed protein product [Toxocara canis]|uniref:Uncharacterized protein n=1 Tax=Toxocara canis TaxID=6265 RepID=A0A183V6R5_TOXCA|nr:unnamed protein product [Toxocara canis]